MRKYGLLPALLFALLVLSACGQSSTPAPAATEAAEVTEAACRNGQDPPMWRSAGW